jgi:hypothetical protein
VDSQAVRSLVTLVVASNDMVASTMVVLPKFWPLSKIKILVVNPKMTLDPTMSQDADEFNIIQFSAIHCKSLFSFDQRYITLARYSMRSSRE